MTIIVPLKFDRPDDLHINGEKYKVDFNRFCQYSNLPRAKLEKEEFTMHQL